MSGNSIAILVLGLLASTAANAETEFEQPESVTCYGDLRACYKMWNDPRIYEKHYPCIGFNVCPAFEPEIDWKDLPFKCVATPDVGGYSCHQVR